MRASLLTGLLALALLLPGCTDPVDQAAKKRVFSAEDPPKATLSAAEPIDTARLAAEPALAHRVLTMGPREAFERLGSHRLQATASFQWGLGKKTVKLSETRTLVQADTDEFSLEQSNDQKQGLSIVRTDGRTFAKSQYLKFREHKRDRGQAEKLRNDAFGALGSASALLNGRLGVAPAGEERIQGRDTTRYLLVLAASPLVAAGTGAPLPPTVFPANGPDPDTKRRLDFQKLRVPQSVQGTLWVDKQTGVPLKSTLEARITTPDASGDDATLVLKINTEISAIGERFSLEPPEGHLPDEMRPPGIAAALQRFDMKRAADKPETAPAEPADEE